MKIVAITGVSAIAALAAASLALPAAAQPYGYYDGPNPCQQQQHNSGTAGALLGGAAGAAIGNGVTHGGGRLGGTVIGGVAGAVIGNNIARGAAKNSDACEAQEQGAYAEPPPPPPNAYNGRYDGRYGYNGYAPPPPPPSQGYYGRGYDDDDGD